MKYHQDSEPARRLTTTALYTPVAIPATIESVVLAVAASELNQTPGAVVSMAGPDVCAPIDANGNLTSDGTKTYFWNALNQLVEVKESTTTIATFEYDGDGRRTEKVAAGLTHTYIYDAEDIVEERLTGSTTDTIRYYHGAAIDEPLARKNSSDVITYYLADHLGSIVQESSAAGAITSEREYDSWGVAIQGGSTSGYAFTGREWDAEIGLNYYRARYYEPGRAQFLSDDPIRFAGGTNHRSYVENAPLRFTDPWGLQAVNACKQPVLVKKERHEDGFMWLKPGERTDEKIDGVKLPNGDWYKAPPLVTVTVEEDGSLPWYLRGFGNLHDSLPGLKPGSEWETRHPDWKFPPDDKSRPAPPRPEVKQ